MSLLIYSGLLYLLGISIVLAFKPNLMFSSNGDWKEFGIGRSREHYTWLPFWLFAIVWAIMSYMIVLVIMSNRTNINNYENNYENNYVNDYNNAILLQKMNANSQPMANLQPMPHTNLQPMTHTNSQPMSHYNVNSHSENAEGFYLINTRNGLPPQKIYLGPKVPTIHYDNM